MLLNGAIISKAPLQIYASALVFSPQLSMIRKNYRDRIPSWMVRCHKVNDEWSQCWQTLEGHSGFVWAVDFSPDCKLVASASDDMTVRLWNTARGLSQSILQGHTDAVNAVAFSPEGTLLASASRDRTIRLWDVTTGKVHKKLMGRSDNVATIVFSPDGKRLASAFRDRTVRVYDVANGVTHITIKDCRDVIIALCFSIDGKLLTSASEDETVRVWNVATGLIRKTVEGHGGAARVTFSSDGNMIASALTDKTIRLWDATTGTTRYKLKGHSSAIRALAFSSDGKKLASASRDKTIRLWDTDTGTLCSKLEGHTNWVESVAFTSDSNLLASASTDRTVKIWGWLWDPPGETALESHVAPETESDRDQRSKSKSVYLLELSHDGRLVASASHDDAIRLWDVATRALRGELKVSGTFVTAIACSSNGKLVAYALQGMIKLADAATGTILRSLKGHVRQVTAIDISPDGEQLASAAWDESLRLWDVATGKTLERFHDRSGSSTMAVALSPDGTLLASTSGCTAIKIWAIDSQRVVQIIALEGISRVRDLSFASLSRLRSNLGFHPITVTASSRPLRSVEKAVDMLQIREEWICWGAKKIIWLPSEYRSTCSAIFENTIVMGHEFGLVTCITIDPTRLKKAISSSVFS